MKIFELLDLTVTGQYLDPRQYGFLAKNPVQYSPHFTRPYSTRSPPITRLFGQNFFIPKIFEVHRK